MSEYDELPDLDMSENVGSEGKREGRPPEPAQAAPPRDAGDAYVQALVDSLDADHVSMSNANGGTEGPLFSNDLHRSNNVSSWHVSGYHEGAAKWVAIGAVPLNISYKRLLRLEAMLWAMDQGVTEFAFAPHHPNKGIIRSGSRTITLDPRISLEVRKALEAYRENQGIDLDLGDPDPGVEGLVMDEGAAEMTRVFASFLKGPLAVLMDTHSTIMNGQLQHATQLNKFLAMSLDMHERSLAKQTAAVDMASEVVMSNTRAHARDTRDRDVHDARMRLEQARLNQSTPFAEQLLLASAKAGKEVSPDVLHRVMFKEPMGIRDVISTVIMKVITGDTGMIDLGPATVEGEPSVDQAPGKPVTLEKTADKLAAKNLTKASALLRSLRGSEDVGAILAALEQAGCDLSDLATIPMASKERARVVLLLQAAVAPVEAEQAPGAEPVAE